MNPVIEVVAVEVEAKKGVTVYDALRASLILSLEENRPVNLVFNGRRLVINGAHAINGMYPQDIGGER